MVSTLSAYLGGLACLAIDKPTDVVIGKALRDTPWEHTLQLKAQAVVLYKQFEKDSLYHKLPHLELIPKRDFLKTGVHCSYRVHQYLFSFV